jgi:uncharacterized membrane protein (DUF4010 family)
LNRKFENWFKPGVSLVVMSLLVWFSPAAPIDPWNLLSPKKVSTMIFALTLIQIMGAAMARVLGPRGGSILTGFLGGLISSTATTASLAKQSKSADQQDISAETLTFLAATAAMLFEGIALLLSGTTEFHFGLSLIFLGPLLMTACLIYRHSNKLGNRALNLESKTFRIVPILKLAAFIVAILVLSKLLQNLFGQTGLIVLTFLVSLFEIHGSVIANVQLHDSGGVGVPLFGGLLAISVLASYLSKLFLICTIGSNSLRTQAAKSTFFLLMSLLVSWLIFAMVI